MLLFAGLVAYVVLSYRAELRNPYSPSAELHAEKAEEVEGPARCGPASGCWQPDSRCSWGVPAAHHRRDRYRTHAGVSEAVIGLTLVAVGTSLPELATSVIAAMRKHADVAVGNVVGSNIFNILGILGITAIVRPLNVADEIARFDVWIMVGVSVVLAALLLCQGPHRASRRRGPRRLYVAYSAAARTGHSA